MRLLGFGSLRSTIWLLSHLRRLRIKGGHAVPFFAVAVLAVVFLPGVISPPSNPRDYSVNEQLVPATPENETDSKPFLDEDVVPNDAINLLSSNESRGTGAKTGAKPAGAILTQAPTGITVPILMYHYIRINPDPADKLGAGLSVPPSAFASQMRYLIDNGYHVIRLDELAARLRKGDSPPAGSVVLTFDDGYMDFYQEAYPVLKRYGLKATSFIITDLVGRKGHLTWDAIREMAGSGLITFGSHTLNHPDLTALLPSAAERQIKESKRILEERTGGKVTLLAYPSGRYNNAVIRLAGDAGYLAAVSTRYGNVHDVGDIYCLKRIRIDGRDNMATFASRLHYVEGRSVQAFVPSITATPTSVLTQTSPMTGTPSLTRQTRQPGRGTPQPSPSSTASIAATATPSSTITVPSVVGLAEAEARQRLNASGLNVGYVNYQQLSDVKVESRDFFLSFRPGLVVSQQPPAGTTVKRGEIVSVAVRKQQ